MADGTWGATLITSSHNGDNEEEVIRIRDEHPGEYECMLRGRVLGGIAVTRGVSERLWRLQSY